jgi:hypothetical protein
MSMTRAGNEAAHALSPAGAIPASWKAALQRFDAAWQAGPPPRIESFLQSADAARTADPGRSLLSELIKIDLEYRWKKRPARDGLPSQPRLEDYRAALPALTANGRLPSDLIAEEYRVRRRFGDRPGRDEYSRRFALGAAETAALFDPVDAELAAEEEPVSATAVAPVSARDLVEALKVGRFLDAPQRAQLESECARFPDASSLARQLLERGWLTPLQANLLLQGRAADLLVGSYLLLDRLGQGWSSHVFRARHLQLDRLVALKVIRKELIAELGPELAARFFQEMQALGRMAHPNVIHAYDAGPIGATFFLAMEYVEGIDLARVVARDGPLQVPQACDYLRQAALGLQHAFERGLVHRDLKPSNLLLQSVSRGPSESVEHRVKLLDLGMARLHLTASGHSHSCLTNDGDFMGTPDYMSPEQAEDPHRADVRADLYSLGCTLFFLLTGRPPFPSGTFLQKVNRHRDEPPPTLETLRKDVPADVVAIVRRLLAKRPEERFQTPAELAAALAGLGSGHRTRRRLLWGAAGALAAAAVGGIALWKIAQPRTPPPRDDNANRSAPTAAGDTLVALEFDGVRQFVALPDNLVDSNPILTVETWFRTARGGVILGCQAGVWPFQGGGFAPRFYVGTDGLLRGGFWSPTLHFTKLCGQRAVNDQRWHHAALVIEPRGLRLYQDGELVAQARGNVEYEKLRRNQIGAGLAASDWPGGKHEPFYFEGRLREFRLWTIPLTAFRIRETMRKTITGKEADLLVYYPMDSLQGDKLVDRSWHSSDGVLGGGNESCRPRIVPDRAFRAGKE